MSEHFQLSVILFTTFWCNVAVKIKRLSCSESKPNVYSFYLLFFQSEVHYQLYANTICQTCFSCRLCNDHYLLGLVSRIGVSCCYKLSQSKHSGLSGEMWPDQSFDHRIHPEQVKQPGQDMLKAGHRPSTH